MSIYTVVPYSITILGDGVATTFAYDLSDFPYSVNFNKTFPSDVVLTSLVVVNVDGSAPDPTYSAVVSINKGQLTVTFNKPLINEPAPTPTNGAGSATVNFDMIFTG